MFDRRKFLTYGAVAAGSNLLLREGLAQQTGAAAQQAAQTAQQQQVMARLNSSTHQTLFEATPAHLATDGGPFHFAVVSDTHVIDRFYVPGSENGVEDNDSILHANERFTKARDTVNGIRFQDGTRIEQVFLPGDVFHNYPSGDYNFYFQNETRMDIAAKILSGFDAPVHIGFGNHDYDGDPKTHVSREMSHRLFDAKLHTRPYYAVDYKGIRFVHMNNFLGSTWAPGSTARNTGSFGEEQLLWAEAQMAERRPTVLFVHYPLITQMPAEVRDFGLYSLLQKHSETILLVVAGHWHRWIDFSRKYGPQHTVIAATRYDPNAFMVFRADGKRGSVEWMDSARVRWATHFSAPYQSA